MRKLTEEDENFIRDNLRYDPDTGYLWWTKIRGSRRCLDKPAGYVHKIKGYVKIGLCLTDGRVLCSAHRIAWFLHYGSWPKNALDHLNGIKWDNKIENLREATEQQNARNQKSRKGSLSKYKGVDWKKGIQKWQSRITINTKEKYLGVYTSEEDAARAYDKVAREHFGEYARLNFPDEHEQGAVHGHDV